MRCGGPSTATNADTLGVCMAQSRRNLEPDPTQPRYFINEPGLGYRLEGANDVERPRS
jgi:two-component system, OmpR family, KDP operon response regulator KdpE